MKTVIFGNGAMARVLYSYARHTMQIAGFTVDDAFATTPDFCGLPLVPFSQLAASFHPSEHFIITAIGFTAMNALREQKYQQAIALGYQFTAYVHPSVFPHDDVTIEENCILLDHVSVHPGCRIGRGTFISSNVNIGHDCDIGENTWINAGVAIAGGCHIGRQTVFGVNACVAHNIRVGARNFIGAGTLLHRSTGDDEVHLSQAGELFPLHSDKFLKFGRVLT